MNLFRTGRLSLLDRELQLCRSLGAFSLAELVISVAIVAVLASLAAVGLARARNEALSAKCISNLRQIHTAQMAFAADNGNRVTPFFSSASGTPTWQTSLSPYLPGSNPSRLQRNSVFQCPSEDFSSPNPSGWGRASYGLNSWMFAPNSAWAESQDLRWRYQMANVEQAARTILLGDMRAANIDFVSTSDGRVWYGSEPNCGPGFRHHQKKRANMIFCDGHVESLTFDELLLNPASGVSRWKWW